MTCKTIHTVIKNPMAWALYLSNASIISVTDEQLAELDNFEQACREGPIHRQNLLSSRIGHIIHALVSAAGAINSRSRMLRTINLLQDVLRDIDHRLLQKAVRGYTSCHIARNSSTQTNSSSPISISPRSQAPTLGPAFLRPLISIAVNRISDKEMSAAAADALATLLSCPSFDIDVDDQIPDYICDEADEQTKHLISMLITEVVLTASPRALSSLSKLLRRDAAREAFCLKDGVSTLASTLQTQPGQTYTAIGEAIANFETDGDKPVQAAYHAVFAVWMLSFSVQPSVTKLALQMVISSRLVVILTRLLNHSSGQRLKIARVTLASLRNLAGGESMLHQQIRKDLLAAGTPKILSRLTLNAGAGSLIGTDEDAVADMNALSELLDKEMKTMTSTDAYLTEVKARALHWSPVHHDTTFWVNNAQKLVEEHRYCIEILANTLKDQKSSVEEKQVACHDLACLIQYGVSGRLVMLSIDGLKSSLMHMMVSAEEQSVRVAALRCVQLLMSKTR